jgi:S-formylglutathione hydrolase FrmB
VSLLLRVDVTTGWFLAGLVLASLLLVLLLRLLRLHRYLAAVVVVLLLVTNAAAWTNSYYDYFRTVGFVLGDEPDDEVALDALLRRTSIPAEGAVAPIPVRASTSRFTAREALVWVPPAWFARPRPELPVIVLLHGTPGSPQDWIDGGRADATADAYAAAHGGRAPILVMPDVNGALGADTECVDGPAGKVETYLTDDVVRYVHETFRTAPPGPAWAVAGLSEGGSCAAMLALRHPALFGSFGDYAGLAGPRTGDTNDGVAPTVAELFGGSRAAFEAHEPAALLATHRYPGTGGWFEVGSADPAPLAAADALAPAARRAGLVVCRSVVDGGGHDFDLFSRAFADSLPWLAGRTGAFPPGPCPDG